MFGSGERPALLLPLHDTPGFEDEERLAQAGVVHLEGPPEGNPRELGCRPAQFGWYGTRPCLSSQKWLTKAEWSISATRNGSFLTGLGLVVCSTAPEAVFLKRAVSVSSMDEKLELRCHRCKKKRQAE